MNSFEEKIEKQSESINSKNERAYIPHKPYRYAPEDDIEMIVPIPMYYLIYNDWIKFRIPKRFFQKNILLSEIVSIPDKIFTGNLVKTGIIDEYEKQYVEDYDFHYFRHSVNISEKHNDKFKIDTVNINCKLNHFLSEKDRPLVTHHYPVTSFSDTNYKGKIKLYISGGLGFKSESQTKAGNVDGEGSVKSNADFEYEYNPKVANISSYANGSELDFTFNRIDFGEERPYPTGALEIFGIIMRPREIKNVALKTSVTVNNHPIPYEGITKLLLSESNPEELSKTSL